MPSIRACAVHPLTNMQARTATICASGAVPFMAPPKKDLPAAMPATCVPCSPETIPMSTNLSLPSIWTTKGTDSRVPVAGLSVPNVPVSYLTL